ncbi:hypothetical protein JXB41_07010 [Candidatus Woesearchaeota archaeon]|nr:hypothetical protein [Candidatus Woesearchaeota archaeon]
MVIKKLRHPKHEFFVPLRRFVRSRKKYLLLSLGILIFILMFKDIFILLLLGTIVMAIDFILHKTRFPIHADFLFFSSLVITRAYGFNTALIFAIIAGNLPEIFTGTFDIPDMLSTIPVILLCFLSDYFLQWNIVILGIIFSVVFALLEFFIALILAEPPHKVIFEPLVVLIINILLFINMGEFILYLMKI